MINKIEFSIFALESELEEKTMNQYGLLNFLYELSYELEPLYYDMTEESRLYKMKLEMLNGNINNFKALYRSDNFTQLLKEIINNCLSLNLVKINIENQNQF